MIVPQNVAYNDTSFRMTSQSSLVYRGWGWGGGQAYNRLSTTHGHITDCKLASVSCMQVYAWWLNVDLSCLGPNDLRPTVFGCQAIQFPHVSRKESLIPFILTPSHPVGCLTQYQAPSWEAQTSVHWRDRNLRNLSDLDSDVTVQLGSLCVISWNVQLWYVA